MSRVEITGRWPAPLDPHLRRAAHGAMEQAVLQVRGEWMRRAQRSRRTGTYLRSITSRVHGSGLTVMGEVGSKLNYAPYLEYGTGLYGPKNRWITPKTASALRWPAGGGHQFDASTGGYQGFKNAPGFRLTGQMRKSGGGKYRYAKRVRGIRPRRFARDAAYVARPYVLRIFRQVAHQAAQQALAAGRQAR